MNAISATDFQISINDDGYIHATSMCQAAGKNLANYKRNKETKSFLKSLEADMRIRISDLVKVRIGDSSKIKQGTWVHPLVAINLAQWCSSEFAVKVSKLVFEWQGAQNVTFAPPVAKIQASQALKLPAVEVDLITTDQLAELDFAIAIAVENSYPASQIIRDTAFYHDEICIEFDVHHYSRLQSRNYTAAMALVQKPEKGLDQPCQIILRAFEHIKPNNMTKAQQAERGLFDACQAIMNIYREHPLKNGGV